MAEMSDEDKKKKEAADKQAADDAKKKEQNDSAPGIREDVKDMGATAFGASKILTKEDPKSASDHLTKDEKKTSDTNYDSVSKTGAPSREASDYGKRMNELYKKPKRS